MSSFLAQSLAFYHSGRLPEAGRACRAALADNPTLPSAWNLLGIVAVRQGQPATAVMPLIRAARLASAEAGPFLANLLAVAPPELAQRAAWRLLINLPDNTTACERLATISQEAGDIDRATVLIERAARLSPFSGQTLLNRTLLLQMAGRISDAVRAARRLLALEPAHATGFGVLGALALALGAPSLGEPAFARAARLEPGHATALQGLARCAQTRRAGGDSPSFFPLPSPPLSPPLPHGLLIRGPLTPVSGYGHMTCRFLDRLVGQSERPVQAVGVFGHERWPGAEAPVCASVALHCMTPPVVEPIPGTRTVVFSMFEGTCIPIAWGRIIPAHDLTVVPCEASRQAWIARGYPEERLRVCPLGVDPVAVPAPPLAITDRQGRPVSSYRHRFLNVSDFIPRKNVDGLLRVWLTATRAGDDAVLILKLGKGSPESRAEIANLLAHTEVAVGRRWEEAAAIAIIDRRLEEAEMEGLFLAASVYWSLSHGEGWDLPLTKAGALGLGLIAPQHSAYVDYLNEKVARMIPATIGPARVAYGEHYWAPFHGLDWWNPDETAAAAIIADIIDGRGPALPDARRHLLEEFSWIKAARRLETILNEAGA